MNFQSGGFRFSSARPPRTWRGRWLALLVVGVAAACGQDAPSDPAPPGDLMRMAACKRGIEEFGSAAIYCPTPSEARVMLRQLSATSFYDYSCRGKDDAPRVYVSESDGTGSVSCLFDAATGQLVAAQQSSDTEDFCGQSSRSITYGEDSMECDFYPGQSCPLFDPLQGQTHIICVLPEP